MGACDSSYVNAELTPSSLGSRPSRLPTLSPGPRPSVNTVPYPAISHQPHSPYLDENVLHHSDLLSDLPSSSHSGSYFGLSPSPLGSLESSQLSSSSSRHAAINRSPIRPRTSSNKVFNNISDLAAHYGIPQFLPCAPVTTPRRQLEHPSVPTQPVDDFSAAPDFTHLCSNYLTMLSRNAGGERAPDVSEDTAPPAPSIQVTDAEAIQSLMDVLKGELSASRALLRWWLIMGFIATPDLQASNDLNEYLTSPLLDSPDDDLLTTPALGSADMSADILTSPLLDDYSGDSFEEFSPLFFSDPAIYEQHKPAPQPEFDGMFKISPTTPLLDSPLSSPFEQSVHSPLQPRRKVNATGTRKNITSESLVPVDAPTQPRKYLTPSTTSRKTVPAAWARKRSRQAAFGQEEDELKDDMGPTLSEQEQIEAKRRQNTVAARRSRKRKLEYQKELEESVERYKRESEAWRVQAQTYLALLHSHQIPVPDMGPES